MVFRTITIIKLSKLLDNKLCMLLFYAIANVAHPSFGRKYNLFTTPFSVEHRRDLARAVMQHTLYRVFHCAYKCSTWWWSVQRNASLTYCFKQGNFCSPFNVFQIRNQLNVQLSGKFRCRVTLRLFSHVQATRLNWIAFLEMWYFFVWCSKEKLTISQHRRCRSSFKTKQWWFSAVGIVGFLSGEGGVRVEYFDVSATRCSARTVNTLAALSVLRSRPLSSRAWWIPGLVWCLISPSPSQVIVGTVTKASRWTRRSAKSCTTVISCAAHKDDLIFRSY